ncbi:carbon-nitrogen hydrolase family protein [Streptomyces termitum]|uniref:Hydrolase n=1 Tax=Streptomyces termitum TaxID=67368 RepID=A0A918T1I4_9ACTN|nr:carbon-nitrogen hydrolase family protein [Streptomyces termitum]GHA80661.1 hydrolase [Streptomyces termitum]
MPALRTALLQSSGRLGDVAANLRSLDEAAGRAAAAGAGLLLAPELFLTGYAIGPDIARLAEPADGPSAREVAATAARHGIAISYGYPERSTERHGVVHNAAHLFGADGTPLLHYRKTHLFGDFEAKWFTPGDQPVAQARIGGLTVGLMICYDVEFPENVRAHALAGTDLLLVPTALMHPAEIVPLSVVPVRAFENQLYLAYANRTGPEGDFEFVGLSALAGPDGTVRARAGRGEELVIGDADPELLAASREENPYLRDRRPELYGSLG